MISEFNAADEKPAPLDFQVLVEQHYETLYQFAMSLSHSEADAWDLTQQTFYTWATKGDQLRDTSKVKTWLFTTLHRAFLQTRRRQARFPHCEIAEAEADLPQLSPVEVYQLDSAQALEALARVDEIYQAPLALYYLEDFPYKEIAEILRVPVGTVKSRIARGLQQLRRLLANASPTTDAGESASRFPRPATPAPLWSAKPLAA